MIVKGGRIFYVKETGELMGRIHFKSNSGFNCFATITVTRGVVDFRVDTLKEMYIEYFDECYFYSPNDEEEIPKAIVYIINRIWSKEFPISLKADFLLENDRLMIYEVRRKVVG